MVRFVVSLIMLFVISSSYADNFKGKTMAVASILGEKLSLVTFRGSTVSKIEEVFIPELKVDDYLQKKLVTELEKRFAVTANVITDSSIFPQNMEFGIMGPSDDEKLAAIKKSKINTDFLILLYPGEGPMPDNFKGGALKSTDMGAFDHVSFRIELLLIDLNKDALITYDNIHEIETYNIKREPLKEERDELAKFALDDYIKDPKREILRDLIYSKPFNRKMLLQTYEDFASNEFDEVELEEVVDEFSYMIDARTTAVTSQLNRYQAHELKKLRGIIYTALDEAVPQLMDIIQSDTEEYF